jgi:hypothetical protein
LKTATNHIEGLLATRLFNQSLDSRGIGTALDDCDLVWQAVLWDGFLEKAQSGLLIAVESEQEVDGLACIV